MFKLLAIGEVMAEIRSSETGFAVGFAGDTYNTAVYAARILNQRDRVGYMTRLGNDPLSAALRNHAASEQIANSYMASDEDKNIGIYSVTTDTSGERSFHYWRHDSAARRLFQEDVTLPKSEIIYLSGITLAILSPQARDKMRSALQQAKDKDGALIAFDSNYRPKLWEDAATARTQMQKMWDMADIALPSIDDEMVLMGDASEADVITRFAARPWHRLAIKRGAQGPAAPHMTASLPDFTPATQIIDTTAAGDSFNGGYFAALLSGKDEAECLLAGHRLAAEVVGVSGAIMPKA